jgi:hypothetical protein
MALGVYSELKNVILVDADVDIFDTNDVLWAMQTRMQGNRDIITLPGVAGHILGPSQQPEYDPTLPAKGTPARPSSTPPHRFISGLNSNGHTSAMSTSPLRPRSGLGVSVMTQPNQPDRLIVGVTCATGIVSGARALDILRSVGIETHSSSPALQA